MPLKFVFKIIIKADLKHKGIRFVKYGVIYHI